EQPNAPLLNAPVVYSEVPQAYPQVQYASSPPAQPYQAAPQVQYSNSPQAQYVQAPVTYVSTNTPKLSGNPQVAVCPSCRSNITTKTEKVVGIGNILGCAVCFLIGCQCGCCLIPFCIEDLKDTEHSCPSCNSLVGKSSML
ncbi:lipopolysaccharide-induced tumor necrosis factor-alpha, partial [Acrasis kona]